VRAMKSLFAVAAIALSTVFPGAAFGQTGSAASAFPSEREKPDEVFQHILETSTEPEVRLDTYRVMDLVGFALSTDANLDRALLAHSRGNPAEALKAFELVWLYVQVERREIAAIDERRDPEAVKQRRSTLAHFESYQPMQAHARASVEYDAKRGLDESIRSAKAKKDVGFFIRTGEALYAANRYDDAIDSLNGALALETRESLDRSHAQLLLGMAHYRRQEYDEASRAWNGIHGNDAIMSLRDVLAKSLSAYRRP
jgi:tetratricopeptide (TPR) repeat protein